MFAIGDHVAYSVQWLKSTGQIAGDAGHARGIIRELIPLGATTLAAIDWQGGDFPPRVNTANLAKVGPNLKFCAG